jgi:hypothetical protein
MLVSDNAALLGVVVISAVTSRIVSNHFTLDSELNDRAFTGNECRTKSAMSAVRSSLKAAWRNVPLGKVESGPLSSWCKS